MRVHLIGSALRSAWQHTALIHQDAFPRLGQGLAQAAVKRPLADLTAPAPGCLLGLWLAVLLPLADPAAAAQLQTAPSVCLLESRVLQK